jgi:hypothetical protein
MKWSKLFTLSLSTCVSCHILLNRHILYLVLIGTCNNSTNSMKHCPLWQAGRRSARQEIPPSTFCGTQKVHWDVHKMLPLNPILSQVNPVQSLITNFFKTHVSIILPSTPWSPIGLFPSALLVKTFYASHFPHAWSPLYYVHVTKHCL